LQWTAHNTKPDKVKYCLKQHSVLYIPLHVNSPDERCVKQTCKKLMYGNKPQVSKTTQVF